MVSSPRRRVRLDDFDAHSEPDLNPRAIPGSNSGDVSHVALTPTVAVVPGDSLSSDLLIGAAAISVFIFGDSSWPMRKRVYRWIAEGVLPGGRLGGQLVSTKSKLSGAIDALISAAKGE